MKRAFYLVASLLGCVLCVSLVAQEFVTDSRLPKPDKVDPSEFQLPGLTVDWSKVDRSSLPQRPKVVTYGAAWCGPCQPVHTAQIAYQQDEDRSFDWEYIDIGRGGLPPEVAADAPQSIPLTIIPGVRPLAGPITSERIELWLQRSGYGNWAAVSIGTLSRKAVGLTQTTNSVTITAAGNEIVFPSATPSITFDPPIKTGNRLVSVSINRARLTPTQAILTAKGWPVEFALDLVP